MDENEIAQQDKYPTTRENYVGIEIECLMQASQDNLEREIIKENLHYNVQIGDDSSVDSRDVDDIIGSEFIYHKFGGGYTRHMYKDRPRNEEGFEIRLLATEKELSYVIKKVCAIIKKYKGRVNKTCGLHVHLDMRQRNALLVGNNLAKFQQLFFNVQPAYRRKSEYCRWVKKIKKTGQHYDSINMEDAVSGRKTIEVRIHEGSVNEKEIYHWCSLLIAIASIKTPIKTTIKSFDNLSWLPKNLKEYLNARIKKYA